MAGRFSAALAAAGGREGRRPAAEDGGFAAGQVVNGRFPDGQWYLATVEADNGDGTFTVAWFDGDTENRVRRKEELQLMRYDPELKSYCRADAAAQEPGPPRPPEVPEEEPPAAALQEAPRPAEGTAGAASGGAAEPSRLHRTVRSSRASERQEDARQPAEQPKNTVRLNFAVDDRMMPVKRPTMRLPGGFRAPVDRRYEDEMPMYVERDGLTPEEVAEIWERDWCVSYASRVKFVSPETEDRQAKYLHPRFDTVPSHPAVIRLEGVPSIIISLVARFREHDPQFADELAAARARAAAEPEERRAKQEQRAEGQKKDMETVLGGRQRKAEEAMRRLAAASGGSFSSAAPMSGASLRPERQLPGKVQVSAAPRSAAVCSTPSTAETTED